MQQPHQAGAHHQHVSLPAQGSCHLVQAAADWRWPLHWLRFARSPGWCRSALLQAGCLFWGAWPALPCLQLLRAAYGALFSSGQSLEAQQSAQHREETLRDTRKATFSVALEGTCRHTKDVLQAMLRYVKGGATAKGGGKHPHL